MRKEIWACLAEQFLDTERRTEIPRAAWLLVRAGYSIREAREIWCYEVTPAVYANVWSVAGEWAYWDDEWLCDRIERLRRQWPNQPGPVEYAIYRLRVHFLHSIWVAIEACMSLFESLPLEAREQRMRDLTSLAALYFDFGSKERLAGRQAELLEVFYRDFLPIFSRLVVCDADESQFACSERVHARLGR